MTTINEVRSWREGLMKQGKVVGFVPTMGALHDGHIALTKQSMKECDATVCFLIFWLWLFSLIGFLRVFFNHNRIPVGPIYLSHLLTPFTYPR